MPTFVHYIPIATTVAASLFSVVLYRHWRSKPQARYLFWWFMGVVLYGVGTLTESLTTVLGWHIITFKAWYISGALLGGAPLAQGTVHLLMEEKTARLLSKALVGFVVAASVFIILSPVDTMQVEAHRLSGAVFEWQWVRAFSPFINTYALIFLVGGAIWSAMRYSRSSEPSGGRVAGNVLIAVGALLPGIGGAWTRAGHVEVLYVTELIGLGLIWWGYQTIRRGFGKSIHAPQRMTA